MKDIDVLDISPWRWIEMEDAPPFLGAGLDDLDLDVVREGDGWRAHVHKGDLGGWEAGGPLRKTVQAAVNDAVRLAERYCEALAARVDKLGDVPEEE